MTAQKPHDSASSDDSSLPLIDNGTKPLKRQKTRSIFSRKLLWIVPCVFIFATGGFVGLYFQPPGLQFFMKITGLAPGGGTEHPIATASPKANEQSIEDTAQVTTALGTLLPFEDLSILAPPYGAVNARVAKLFVQEGQTLHEGDIIATMDNLGTLQAQLDTAKTDVEVAQAKLEQTKLNLKNNRLKALAEVERNQINYHQSSSDAQRGNELIKQGVITQSELDKLLTLEQASLQALQSAKANLNNFQYEDISQHTEVRLAQSDLAAAQSRMAAKQEDVNNATLRAPSDGVILSIHARVGERPGESGIASFGDTSRMQAKLEVYQSDITHVHNGAAVTLRSQAIGDQVLKGHVSRIGLEVKKQQLVAQAPAANTDARVVIVTVELEPNSSLIAASFNGLEVIATIHSEQSKS